MDPVEKIAATVLYEGYVLWPYRRSAKKNQQRWTFGGVFPRVYSETSGSNDPWLMQTECLVTGAAPTASVKVQFLHVVERRVGRRNEAGTLDFVDELEVGAERYLAWDEAVEREVMLEDLSIPELGIPTHAPIEIPSGQDEEPIVDPDGEAVGALVRSWRRLEGEVEIRTEQVRDQTFKLTVTITNSTPWEGLDRESTLKQTFVSTHTIVRAKDGEFVSQTDPPQELAHLAEKCENIKTWPVLAGESGDRRTILSSPIILYDYPQIAPESPGDLFDATEIDQLLVLNILTLTDEEKEEMRATDPRAREILERSEAFTPEDFMSLHGTMRDFRMVDDGGGNGDVFPNIHSGFAELERPAPESVVVQGVTLRQGSKVRLRPRAGGDIFDIALAGKVAYIEAIEQDYEDRIHVSVTVEDDPGRALGEERVLGHRFFFSLDEIEPIEGV